MYDEIYMRIGKLLEEQKQAAVATLVEATKGTPRKIGAKMLIMPDGEILGTIGGGILEKTVMEKAVEVCRKGEPVMLEESLTEEGLGASCGGKVAVYIEPILKKSPMFVFGGGHIGKAIAQMAQYMDFSLNIVDARPEWANKENYPMECRFWTGDILESARDIPTDEHSYIIILTHSAELDEEILRILLKKEYAYMGMIGSRFKHNEHFKSLLTSGFTKEDFARFYAPIGLPIGAYSPHEIAVSVLSEIIAVQKEVRNKLPGWEGGPQYR